MKHHQRHRTSVLIEDLRSCGAGAAGRLMKAAADRLETLDELWRIYQTRKGNGPSEIGNKVRGLRLDAAMDQADFAELAKALLVQTEGQRPLRALQPYISRFERHGSSGSKDIDLAIMTAATALRDGVEMGTPEPDDGRAACHNCGGRYKRKKNGMPRGHSGPRGSYCRSPHPYPRESTGKT